MNFVKKFSMLCMTVSLFSLCAGESLPMKLFKEMRDAAIKNDSATALSITGGKLLEKIKNSGEIPLNMRTTLIYISAAYEDIHIRNATPEKATVYAFATENGKLSCIEFLMENNENSMLKISEMNIGPHLAMPHFEKFLAACKRNDLAHYRDLITPETAEKYPKVPISLQVPADEKITTGAKTADSTTFNLDRGGIKGTVKMKKSGYFWKVSEIDSILLAPMPSQVVEELCNAAGKTADVETLKKYFIESAFETVKGKLSPEKLTILAGINSVISQKSSGNRKFDVQVKIAGATDSGTASFKLGFENDNWLIADFDAETLVYKNEFAPGAVITKFAANFLKDKNSEAVKDLIPEELLKQLGEKFQNPSPELTATIEKEEINGKKATVTAAISNSPDVGKLTAEMKLENGKWLITGIQTQAPEKKAEDAETAPAETPAQ
ncbi:MAG: hypothetical protein J6W00_13270 [Lentisphaeria bacterium]|nr:hypothetical protein [Lentisphaeria bacterium]